MSYEDNTSNESFEDGTSEFNMSFFVFKEIHRLRLRKSICAISHDLNGWYDCLEEIYRLIYPLVSAYKPQLDQEIEEDFRVIRSKLFSNTGNIADRQIRNTESARKETEAKRLLHTLDKRIQYIMNEQGILMPRISKGLKKLSLKK